MMHAKVMTVDGIAAVVGSSNFNRRSLDHDEEVVLIALDRDLTATLDAHLDEDFERSERDRPHAGGATGRRPSASMETAVKPIRRWM